MSRQEKIEKYIQKKLMEAKKANKVLVTITSGIPDVLNAPRNIDVEVIDTDELTDSDLKEAKITINLGELQYNIGRTLIEPSIREEPEMP
jgi:S-adenosylmethionine synthetase